jgi:hypothetical protein
LLFLGDAGVEEAQALGGFVAPAFRLLRFRRRFDGVAKH